MAAYINKEPVIKRMEGMERISDDDLQALIEDTKGKNYCRPYVLSIAKDLLEERKQPKVWDDAPEDANNAQVHYWDGHGKNTYSDCYTRELPKSPIREIAEKAVGGLVPYFELSESGKATIVNRIESAIKEAMELNNGK
jgi:hypothetical protein